MNHMMSRLAKFIRNKYPEKRTLRIDITADKNFFEQFPDFQSYFKTVEPDEEAAFMKGYLTRAKEEKTNEQSDDLVPSALHGGEPEIPERQAPTSSEVPGV